MTAAWIAQLANNPSTTATTNGLFFHQEAIMNSMFANQTMTGRDGFTVRGLPIAEVREILRRYNRLAASAG